MRAVDAARQRARRRADPEGQRRRSAAFKARLEAKRFGIAGRPRPSLCELCCEPALTVWDHDHATGRFRGWLCDRCNRVLGSVKDSPALLIQMVAYLLRSTDGEIVRESPQQAAQ